MIQANSYSELSNQAVPGYQNNLSSYETNISECQVPSPSQWSDPCRSPPESLHSPMHIPSTFERMHFKEEPYSPQTNFNSSSPPTQNCGPEVPKESSLNLDSFINDNYFSVETAFNGCPRSMKSNEFNRMSKDSSLTAGLSNDSVDFLDTLVDIKKEEDDFMDGISGMTPPVSPERPHQPTFVPIGDVLRTVEMMALDHFRRDLQRVSMKLNIPKDPSVWTLEESKIWLTFQANHMDLPTPRLESWSFAGPVMLKLTEANFRQLIPQGGELLYAKLEIWREALRTLQQESSQNPQTHQNSQDVQFIQTTPNRSQSMIYEVCSPGLVSTMQKPVQNIGGNYQFSSGSPAGADVQVRSVIPPPPPYSLSQQLEVNVNHGIHQQHVPQLNTHQQTVTNNNQMVITHHPPQITTSYFSSSPAPLSPQIPLHVHTGPPSIITSLSSPIQPHSPSSYLQVHSPSSYLAVPSPPMTPHPASPNHLAIPYQHHGSSSPSPSPSLLSPVMPPVMSPIMSPQPQERKIPPQQSQQQHFTEGNAFLEESLLDIASFLHKTESMTSPARGNSPPADRSHNDEEDVEEAQQTTAIRAGTHIHLWQFLKELLQQSQLYGSCIRWLDRSKGIFKIEDSVRVAKLWGKRKNRPAMNYDKLSRSIRQYYKKGIMKKTERSQRLVYQFCHPYCL